MVRMREVSVRMLHFLMDLARTAELDEAPLLAGLPSLVPREGETLRWFDWEDFVELQERVEKACGGPVGFKRVARLALPSAYPEFRAMAAIFVSPISLFTFVVMRLMRTSFRTVDVVELSRIGDHRIRWRETIPAGARGSATFFRISRTMAELLPIHLDLPEATVELTPLGLHVAELDAQFPPLPPLAERGRLAVSAATSLIAGQLDTAFAHVVDATRADRTPFVMSPTDAEATALWADRLALSPRQRTFLAPLLAGRSNKEIARIVGCSGRNVEFHVSRILRAAKVSSRAELLVKILGAPR
jgi:DNA-binding CsgD family transcriptional regulator